MEELILKAGIIPINRSRRMTHATAATCGLPEAPLSLRTAQRHPLLLLYTNWFLPPEICSQGMELFTR